MIVSGTAGTGKSFLISAIAVLLGDSCLLTGAIGIAAFNICGMTLHSTLQLQVGSHNNGDLKGRSLAQLQQRFLNRTYLIVDEMSLVGQNCFFWVDRRMRQATGHLDKPLGGVSVITLNFRQWPTVHYMRPPQPLTTLRTATPSISCSLQSSFSITLSVRTVSLSLMQISDPFSDCVQERSQKTTGDCCCPETLIRLTTVTYSTLLSDYSMTD